MKLDKETLVKHQFWLLLGLSGVLTLAALVLLFLGPAAKARTERTNFQKFKDTLGPKNSVTRDPKNPSFLVSWNKRRKFFTKHKNTVWEGAWKKQSDIMTWPRDLAKLEQGHFGDDIPDPQRLSYKQQYYDQQFTPEAFFAPDASEGVYFPVTFDKDKIFGRRVWDKTKPVPTVEECWMAQEDIWVRREILKDLQRALRAMGHFKPVRQPLWRQSVPAVAGAALDSLVHDDPRAKLYKDFTGVRLTRDVHGAPYVVPGDAPKGTVRSLLFCSHNWEVNLLLEKPNTGGDLRISGHSTIRNISPARRALALNNSSRPLPLRLRQGDGPGRLIHLEGELLRWGEVAEFKKSFTPNSIDLSKDFDLEEDFDPATSPIKVLEELKVGRDAIYHRFVAGGFLMQKGRLAPKEKEPENAEGQPTPGPGGPQGAPQGGSQGGPQGGPQGGMPLGPKGQATAAADDVTPNGINRLRYVLSKEIEPVRRIPVAFTIVVDQAYRNEVLAAIANSRLRIQTTQVYWTHRDYKPLKGTGVVGGFVPRDRMMPPGSVPPTGPMGPVGPEMGSGRRPTSPPPPGGSGVPPRGSGVPPGGSSPPPGERFTPPGVEPAPPADNAAASDRNLVELTVHGIAALFERYPAKKKAPEGETPNNPTAPR